jgi:hypothetical protein
MANIQALTKASSWRNFFMENSLLDYSNDMLTKINDSAHIGISSTKIFKTFSKNPGIGLLCLDSDGSNLTMIHNPGLTGGSWLDSDIKLLAMMGFSEKAIAIKIQENSISNTKHKVPSLGVLTQAIRDKNH